MNVAAKGFLEIANIDASINKLRKSLVDMREFNPFHHFLHLSQYSEHRQHKVDLQCLKRILSIPKYDKSEDNLLQCVIQQYDTDCDGMWSYSDYLKFIYSSM